ncbi:MAG: branched-chain amino acid ABC transporter permease [Candidatus Limnocylindrales bacterium]|jgi:ABC-type branched-subunit amino acid transport system permease subunit
MNARARASSRLAPVRGWFGRHQSLSIIAGVALAGVVLPYLILLPPFSGFGTQLDWVDGFANAGVFVLLAIGLNVVVGLSGLLDLGYAAFFAIGAYTYALADSPFSGLHLPFWPMLLVGALVAGTFGLLLGAPTLRLRGDYLAIVTLGFGEIVPVVFLQSSKYTEGVNGIGGVYTPSLLNYTYPIGDPWPYYLTMAVILALVMIFVYRLQDSRLGRAWMAIREDELAAASMGINTVTTKLLAFAIGASTSGFAGVFLASKVTLVSTDSFHFDTSFTILAMVVLGGMGNIWGVAVGAFLVFELQTQGLKQLNSFLGPLNIPVLSSINFLNYQFLIYGLVLVLMMLSRPEGLFPSRRRRAELHEAGVEAAVPDVAPE